MLDQRSNMDPTHHQYSSYLNHHTTAGRSSIYVLNQCQGYQCCQINLQHQPDGPILCPRNNNSHAMNRNSVQNFPTFPQNPTQVFPRNLQPYPTLKQSPKVQPNDPSGKNQLVKYSSIHADNKALVKMRNNINNSAFATFDGSGKIISDDDSKNCDKIKISIINNNSINNIINNNNINKNINKNHNDDGSSISSSTLTTVSSSNLTTTNTVNEHFFDERVQVDRRKLEQMITATRDLHINQNFPFGRYELKTTAEEFFSQVMTRTNTQITWPSRLKIGAKTKKDPYVKIFGRFCDVQSAKRLILSVLETRHTRVTLKIDVAFTDHSHVIGKYGRNTQLVMKETGCHVHFPDSNRHPDMEKSNMVSIAGPLENVEKARHAIRSLAPLVITFEMKSYVGASVADLNDDSLVQEIAAAYNLNILIRPNRSSGQPFVVVKGSMHQEPQLKEAVLRLQQHFLKTTIAICSSSIEILPSQQATVIGANNSNILIISQLTGASIHHPKSDSLGATTFFIQGTLESVLTARKHILGCLPISLTFEATDAVCKTVDLREIEKQHDLLLCLKPKKTDDSRQSIIIKGSERQLCSIYSIKGQLDSGVGEKTNVPSCTDYEFMQEFDNMARMSNIFPALFSPTIATISPLLINTPMSMASPLLGGLPTPVFDDTGSLTQIFTFPCLSAYSAQPTVSSLVNSAALYQQQPPHQQPSTTSYCSPVNDASSSSVLSASSSNVTTVATTAPSFGVFASTPVAASRDTGALNRHQSGLNRDGVTVMPGGDYYSDLNERRPVDAVGRSLGNGPGDSLTNVGGGGAFGTPSEPLVTGLLSAAKKIQENAAANDQWKAPGAERTAILDYSRQRILATKAMQEKPLGVRTPNDHWSGYGFSRSTPAHELRNRLQLSRALRNHQQHHSQMHQQNLHHRNALVAPGTQHHQNLHINSISGLHQLQNLSCKNTNGGGEQFFGGGGGVSNADDDCGGARRQGVAGYGAGDGGGRRHSSAGYMVVDGDSRRQNASGAAGFPVVDVRRRNSDGQFFGANRQLMNGAVAGGKTSTILDDLLEIDDEGAGADGAADRARSDDDDDVDTIGPWLVEKTPTTRDGVNGGKAPPAIGLNSTTYFDFVQFPKTADLSFGVHDVITLLTNLQLTKYIDTFREQEIDMKTFLTMTDEDLKELGVNTFGARRKMLVAISEMKERRKLIA